MARVAGLVLTEALGLVGHRTVSVPLLRKGQNTFQALRGFTASGMLLFLIFFEKSSSCFPDSWDHHIYDV